MKLIAKTSAYYIGFSIIGFIIGGFIFYHIIFSIINKRTNDDLKTEIKLIEEQIIHSDSIPDFTQYFGHQIVVTIFNQVVIPNYSLRDTILIDSVTNDEIPHRYIISFANKNNKSYSIELFKPLIKTNQLAEDIFVVMFIMFLFLLLSLILIDYFISRKIWSPFYNTLKQIKEYDISTANSLTLNESSITEFRQLNEVLLHMSKKISNNYFNLKEFTENASHEIQTPLAIIKSKLELLIQSHPLTNEQMKLVHSMYNSVSRLSKLNTNLVLLSKIENSQFHELSKVNLSEIIESVLLNLDDLIIQKELVIHKDFPEQSVEIVMNPTLADVLIINLISNAVKHNIKNGQLNISLTGKSLEISNSGLPLEVDPELMFDRFKKSKTSSESLGLGLSIVKKITSINKMVIFYTYASGIHTLTLTF
jgi:signal transduction histidine kinase